MTVILGNNSACIQASIIPKHINLDIVTSITLSHRVVRSLSVVGGKNSIIFYSVSSYDLGTIFLWTMEWYWTNVSFMSMNVKSTWKNSSLNFSRSGDSGDIWENCDCDCVVGMGKHIVTIVWSYLGACLKKQYDTTRSWKPWIANNY